MSPDETVDLDPELLSDPLGEEESGKESGRKTEPVQTGALVPSGERGLAPADPFRRYLAEIRRYAPLDREEERELARRFRDTGDQESLFRLITANLMLVVRIAMSFRRAARNLLDLVQEGNVGLMYAIDKFDPELGVRLPTYASWWIRAYMVKFMLDNFRLVRVGTTNARRKLLYNLRKEKARLEQLGYEAGPRQLAERFGVSEEDVEEVQKALSSHDLSIDAPVDQDEEGHGAGDWLPSGGPSVEEDVARQELQERVERVLAKFREDLGDRERAILDERILSDDRATLQVLGDRFGTTREAVRQAEVRLMKRLREYVRQEMGDLGDIHIGPS